MYRINISKIFVSLLLFGAALATINFVTQPTNFPPVDRTYDSLEQLRAIRTSTFHDNPIEQVRLERSSHLSADRSYDGIEGLRTLRTDVMSAADFSYDLVEQVRRGRSFIADRRNDTIENLRLER